MGLFKKLAIDLGTANSLVYVAGEGIVLDEPTVVAVSTFDRTVVAVGTEAKKMLGRTPDHLVASRPMRDGVIADYTVTEAMIRFLIRKVMGRAYLLKPEVMVCVPAGCTQVERRAVMDATAQAGARRVYLIDEPLAAAIGAGLPIGEPSGNMVLDIGGGAAEAAIISLGGVVAHRSTRVGGTAIDEAVADFVKKKFNLIIGEQTAEWVKIALGDALPADQPTPEDRDAEPTPASDETPPTTNLRQLELKGRDAISGLPRSVIVTAAQITEAIQPPLLAIVSTVKEALERVPPELSSDIIDRGVVMTGGTSQLTNLPRYIARQTGVPAYLAEDPMRCVVRGTGSALEHLDAYRRAIISG